MTLKDALEQPFVTAGYAVLRDAIRAGNDVENWVKISPEEARHIREDLLRAEEARSAFKETV